MHTSKNPKPRMAVIVGSQIVAGFSTLQLTP